MSDDEQQTYHHNAAEGETRAPSGDTDPHHALNTPAGRIDEDAEGERLEESDDRAEDERASEERSRNG